MLGLEHCEFILYSITQILMNKIISIVVYHKRKEGWEVEKVLQIKETFLSPEKSYWENNRVLFSKDRETHCSSVNSSPDAGFKSPWVDGGWLCYLYSQQNLNLVDWLKHFLHQRGKQAISECCI